MMRSFSPATSNLISRFLTACAVVGVGLALLPAAACKSTGVGDPCTPEAEYNTQFNGFSVDEVNFESKSFQCQTRLCLVNHFQGRVSCQYGQDTNGNGPPGYNGCKVPNDPTKDIVGDPNLKDSAKVVQPQCANRNADKAVYCSCRCANADGKTDDGLPYCDCPDGFSCSHLVDSISSAGNKISEGLTGSFCIKQGSDYDINEACQECNPATASCPGQQTKGGT